jgi:hypothetical protein
MGRVSRISMEERAAAYYSAVDLAKTAVGEGDGFVSPHALIGRLSAWEWMKLCDGAVSGWIAARSRQLTAERWGDESFFLATGEDPPAAELGVCAFCLPALGELIEKMGLTDKPIEEWSKREVMLFVWHAAEFVTQARARRDEGLGEASVPELLAG